MTDRDESKSEISEGSSEDRRSSSEDSRGQPDGCREGDSGRDGSDGPGRHANYHRKLWHLSSGAFVVAALVIFSPSKKWAIVLLSAGLALMIAIDAARYFSRRGKRLFWKHLGFLTSEKERKGPTTSLYYAASLLLCVIIFPVYAAIGGVISLAAGDPVAAIVGRRYGRLRIGGKSIEGGLANTFVAFCLILIFVRSFHVAAAGALAGAIVEMFDIPYLDDNITVPLAAGGAMAAAVYLFGM
jgi:dolichol kinase